MDWIKGFCKAKETINKPTKCTKWEKIVANDMLSEVLIPKIHKQHMQLNM